MANVQTRNELGQFVKGAMPHNKKYIEILGQNIIKKKWRNKYGTYPKSKLERIKPRRER